MTKLKHYATLKFLYAYRSCLGKFDDKHMKIQVRILKLEAEIQSGTRPLFDLAFIDADKGSYPVYWEACFKLLRKGGAILVDNVLWSGGVLNPEDKSDHTIQAFNELVKNDIRVEKVMLPVRDGITLAVVIDKKPIM